MDAFRFSECIRSGQLTRREVHHGIAAFGITATAIPATARALSGTGEAMVFTWGGNNPIERYRGFVDRYGQMPEFTYYGDEEESYAKLMAGFRPDVTGTCTYELPRWYESGLLAPVDTARLEHWPDVFDSLKTLTGSVVDGAQVFVPDSWGQTSVLYRTDLVDIEEESWGLLWDDRYAGRIGMIDSLIDGVAVAAIYAGVDPWNIDTPEKVERVAEALRLQRPLLRMYTNDMTTVEQALASGELVAAVTWNGSVLRLTEQGLPVRYMVPKEGIMTWVCDYSVLPGSEDREETYVVLDSILSPEAGVYNLTENGEGHANRKAFTQVSVEFLASIGITGDVEEYLAGGIFQDPMANKEALQNMFDEVKSGF